MFGKLWYGMEKMKWGDYLTYQWKPGARIRVNAQIAGQMCQQLESEGRLSAKNLLDANRPEDAPLHHEFEWNDGKAAELYREQQARTIINSLIVLPDNAEPVRAYFKIESVGNTYQSIRTIMQKEDSRQALFDVALRELSAIRRKYDSITKLSAVWESIKAIESEQQKEEDL